MAHIDLEYNKLTGIHISSRQVVRDDYKVLRTSIKNHKLVRWTSKF